MQGHSPPRALTEQLHGTVAESRAAKHLYHELDGDPLEDGGWQRLAAFCLKVTAEDPRWKRYGPAVKQAINDCLKGDRNTDWVADQGMGAVIEQAEGARKTWEQIQAAGAMVTPQAA